MRNIVTRDIIHPVSAPDIPGHPRIERDRESSRRFIRDWGVEIAAESDAAGLSPIERL